jgi:hypothetical protein
MPIPNEAISVCWLATGPGWLSEPRGGWSAEPVQ